MKKFITISPSSNRKNWIIWINNKLQIFRDTKEKYGFGYHDQYKEYGILEEDVFTKSFCLNHIMICWCDGQTYRRKHKIPHYWEDCEE